MKMTSEMEAFLNEVKAIMLDGHKMYKKVKELEALGCDVKLGGSHYRFTHKFLGRQTIILSNTPSDYRWAKNMVSVIRHAMWKAAA